MSCDKRVTRRDFIKWSGYLSFLSSILPGMMLDTLISNPSYAISLDPAEWIAGISFSCVMCRVEGFCFECCPPIILPKTVYWLPIGYMENTLAFEFGAGLPFIGEISSILAQFIETLMPFVPRGTYTRSNGHYAEEYQQLYPHYFGFPIVVRQAIQAALLTVANLSPICLACDIIRSLINTIMPVHNIFTSLHNMLNKIKQDVESFGGKLAKDAVGAIGFGGGAGGSSGASSIASKMLKFLKKIQYAYEIVEKIVPFFPSELFFFIWQLEAFSPDNHTVAPLFDSLIETVSQMSPPVGAFFCPDLMNYIAEGMSEIGINFPLGIDPDFICVGRWGFGYPRIGAVRSGTGEVGSLLGITRFYQLFSDTFPFISPSFSMENTKYQMISPSPSKQCFRPGEWSNDPIADDLYTAESYLQQLPNILSYVENLPTQASNGLSSLENSVKARIGPLLNLNKQNLMSTATQTMEKFVQQRKVGVVVWHKYSKCCA